MAEATAKATIEVVDQATEKLNQIYQAVKRLEEAQKQTQEVSGSFLKGLNDLSVSMTGMSLSTLGVAGAYGVLIKSSIEAADELNAVHNRAETLFGSDFPKMVEQSNALASAMGRNSSEILNFETHISAVLQSLDIGSKQTQEMSGNLTKLAVDFGKAFHVDEAQAVRDIEMALRGNTRALIDYDIAISKSTLQQYANSKGIEVNVEHMDAQQKALLMYHYLMDKTHAIQAAADKDTGDLNDSLKRMEAAWNNLEENLGQNYLPVMTLVIGATEKAIHVVEGLGSAVAYAMEGAQRLLHGGSASTDFTMSETTKQNIALQEKEGIGMGKGRDAWLAKEKKAGDEWSKGWVDHSKEASEKSGKHLEDMQNKMDELAKKYEQDTNEIGDKLSVLKDQHESKVSQIQDSIDNLKDSLKDLKNTYDETVNGMNRKGEDLVQKQDDLIQRLKDKMAELEKKSLKEQSYGGGHGGISADTNDEIAKTKKELEKAEGERPEIVKTLKITDAQLGNVAKRETQGTNLTAAQDLSAEQGKKLEEYNKKVDDVTKKLNKKNLEMDEENKNYEKQEKLLHNTEGALRQWHDTLVVVMRNAEAATKKSLESMNTQLDNFMKKLQSMQKLITAQSAADLGRSVQLQGQGSSN